MKVKIWMPAALVFAMSLTGCGKKKPDPTAASIKDLMFRVDTLESNLNNQREFCLNLRLAFLTNVDWEMKFQGEVESRLERERSNMLGNFADILSIHEELENVTNAINRRGTPQTTRQIAQPQDQYKNGVPISVYNAIAKEAAELHPGDYEGQESRINREIEAYKKLHP